MSVAAATMSMSRAGAVSPADLAELIGAFTEVTSRLEATHATLRGEVARLEAELREANEQLRRSERLAALGEMAAGIAHEVRNPLGSIRLYAEILSQDLQDRPEERTVADKIGAAVRGLDAIVGDVLAFARPTCARVEPLDAGSVFDDALDVSRASLEQARVEVERQDRGRPPVRFEGDPGLLRQALVNILRNAADAVESSGGPGRVVLLAQRRRVRVGEKGSARTMASLVVRDSGPGVPEDVIGRMFNPFVTTRAAGTGLGLAIVHRIADAHGGRVSVRNHPEGGAEVEILLPVATAQEKAT